MLLDWETTIRGNPWALDAMRIAHPRPRTARRGLATAAVLLLAAASGATSMAYWQSGRLDALEREARTSQQREAAAQTALASLATSHSRILAATEQAPSIGTRSWGRRFNVTMYVPRSSKYGRFNTGFTSTQRPADPTARIVAVDPKLIPYGSSVWVEGLGWFDAQDTGSAIRGFRLDVLTAAEHDAFAFGRQDRFVIVVPPVV
jgi:3D (Asp-Asp-Asp) domain-containing protein